MKEWTIGFPQCPYWRRFIKYGDYALSLCSAESEGQQPPSSVEEGRVRLSECPLWGRSLGRSYAFNDPVIMEIRYGKNMKIDIIDEKRGPFSGRERASYLEEIWNQEVEKFIQRHSK